MQEVWGAQDMWSLNVVAGRVQERKRGGAIGLQNRKPTHAVLVSVSVEQIHAQEMWKTILEQWISSLRRCRYRSRGDLGIPVAEKN